MAVIVSESLHVPRPTWYRGPVKNVKDVKNVASGGVRGDHAKTLWSWRIILADGVALLALAWTIPFAILLVGTPVALTLALLLWIGRLTLNAF
jgi:hypothetical protein